MAKRRRDPLWSISWWVSDKDIAELRWAVLIIVALVAALWWRQ